jgi:hypothetical protein
MRFFLPALIGLVLLCGCADPARSPFDPVAAAVIHEHGTGVIEGKAFAANDLGHVVYAAGQRVYLIPATPYARERFAALYFGGHDLPVWIPEVQEVDPRYRDFIRTTVADAGGSFRFDALAPGTYIVATQVSWKLENRLIPDGKKMFETVIVTGQEKEPVQVVVAGA